MYIHRGHKVSQISSILSLQEPPGRCEECWSQAEKTHLGEIRCWRCCPLVMTNIATENDHS